MSIMYLNEALFPFAFSHSAHDFIQSDLKTIQATLN